MSKITLEVIKELRDAKGSNAKIEIIKANKDNNELKTVVDYTLNPLRSYNVTRVDDLPPPNPLFGDQESKTYNLNDAFTKLDYLYKKGSATNTDKMDLALIKQGLSVDDAAILDIIVARDLKCGCGLSTFRKVYGDKYVPDFPVMKCQPYNYDEMMKNIDWSNAYSQLKSDGARCQILCFNLESDNPQIRSGNGKPFYNLTSLESAAKQLTTKFGDCVLDGELVVVNSNGDICSRQVGNGILNKASSGTISQEEADRVVFMVWDIIIREEFEGDVDKSSKLPYSVRWEHLEKIVGLLNGNNRIRLQETRKIGSLVDAMIHYNEMLKRGEEGTIVKNGAGVWEGKRSKSQFKFKEEHPGEFIITGWYHGKKGTKYENHIGGLYIETADGLVKSGVGSGLSDAMRKVDNPDQYIGKVVEIKYNARTITEDSKTQSLFLPRVVEIRLDKDEADTLEKLIRQEEASRDIKTMLEKL